MTNRERATERARQLLMTKEVTAAFIELEDYLGDMAGSCPSCGQKISRYESDRVTHARLCDLLIRDAQIGAN